MRHVTLLKVSVPPTWHSQGLRALWASFILSISLSSTPATMASGPQLLSEAIPCRVPVLWPQFPVLHWSPPFSLWLCPGVPVYPHSSTERGAMPRTSWWPNPMTLPWPLSSLTFLQPQSCGLPSLQLLVPMASFLGLEGRSYRNIYIIGFMIT